MTQLAELSLSKACREILEILIESDDDEFAFIHSHLNNPLNGSTQAAQEFRLYKITQRSVTFERFEKGYKIDKKIALQKLFLHRISKCDVDLLEHKIHNKSITLKELYDLHTTNPEKNMILMIRQY